MEVLDFVRPIRLQVEHTSIADVLQRRDQHGRQQGAARRASRCDVAMPSDLPPIQGDQHQLLQLFTNLLINAFEALDGRGHVRIVPREPARTRRPRRRHEPAHVPTVVVEVSDDGPGMPQEVVDRIFNPFFTTKAQGSGLGLAIVRKIVDAHDGRIDISRRPGAARGSP